MFPSLFALRTSVSSTLSHFLSEELTSNKYKTDARVWISKAMTSAIVSPYINTTPCALSMYTARQMSNAFVKRTAKTEVHL